MALIINLNNWFNQYLTLEENIVKSKYKMEMPADTRQVRRWVLKIATIIITIIFMTMELYTGYRYAEDDSKYILRFLSVGTYCIILSFLFMVASLLILCTLKKEMASLYNKYNRLLITAAVMLSLPILLRGVLDIIVATSSSFAGFIGVDNGL